jgi:Domain of unknown function (DUF1841)
MKTRYRPRRQHPANFPRWVNQARPQRQVKYPIATIAYYGPDDKHVTKIAVGIIESENAEPIMERWLGPDVMTNREVQLQMLGFIEAHGVQEIVITDGVLGCPHEEGIDFPEGQECPYCPFWRGKHGIQVEEPPQAQDPLQALKAVSRYRMRLIWQMGQRGLPLGEEDGRLVSAMREHPEYGQMWDRLDELSDAEIERDGTNPIMHVIVHTVIENQLLMGEPKEVGRVYKALLRQGLARHEVIHRLGSALIGEVFHILKDKRPFDEANYVRKLRELLE